MTIIIYTLLFVFIDHWLLVNDSKVDVNVNNKMVSLGLHSGKEGSEHRRKQLMRVVFFTVMLATSISTWSAKESILFLNLHLVVVRCLHLYRRRLQKDSDFIKKRSPFFSVFIRDDGVFSHFMIYHLMAWLLYNWT